jgi:hypothetical protein
MRKADDDDDDDDVISGSYITWYLVTCCSITATVTCEHRIDKRHEAFSSNL